MEKQKAFYRPSASDTEVLQKVSSWTRREAEKGNMVYRSAAQMQEIAAKGDSLLLLVDDVAVAHAARTHAYARRAGPFGILSQHIHEIGAVVTEEGFERNGYARDIVIEAVRQQLKLSARLRRGELIRPQVIAMVQVDNVGSNRFFSKLGERVDPHTIPQDAFQTESVGSGESAHQFYTYDITHSLRRRR
jgi:hypothetical protein